MAGELISREALERIVRRAAELQASEQDIGDGLTEQQVLALGNDVGIPARYLRQAMLDEQTRAVATAPRGFLAWLAGPSSVGAHRVVPGDRAVVERALARWLEEEELLQPKRRFPDHTTWEPKAGAFASIQRALAGGRRYALARTVQITTQVVQLEPGFCHVRIEADVRKQRAGRLSGAAVMTIAGWTLTGLLLGLPIVLPVADAVALIPGLSLSIGAVAVARVHRGENERTLVAQEQVLDRLERGEIRAEHALPGPRANAFVRVAEEIRKVFEI
ncbi:MAG TPA: hypothetical protein VGA20_05295 [Gemmatimonadales bacterium]